MERSLMFHLWKDKRIKTNNCFHGCRFDCYGGGCWAKRMALRLKASKVQIYEDGFEPKFVPKFLEKSYNEEDIVFVAAMGDISFATNRQRKQIVDRLVKENPQTTFFFESKDPQVFEEMLQYLEPNVVLSTTIETNRQSYKLSKAPTPRKRFEIFQQLDWNQKHISIEPIVEFDMDPLLDMVKKVGETSDLWVSVGFDNYGNDLPEPSSNKVDTLLKKLKKSRFVSGVEDKRK